MTNIVFTPTSQIVVIQSTGTSSIISVPTVPQVVVSSFVSQSVFRTIEIKLVSDVTPLPTGDLVKWCVPSDFDGMNLVDIDAFVTTVSSSGNQKSP